jgi:CBS domain containing-hemolysin-like protein
VRIIIPVILALVFLLSVLIDQAVRSMPIKELRRRARHGNHPEEAAIYKVAGYGRSVQALLWILGTASVAGLFLMAISASTGIAVLLVIIASWIMAVSHPLSRLDGFLGKMAAKSSPLFVFLLSHLNPILRPLAKARKTKPHTGLYEKEDLLELLNNQRQHESRINPQDLQLATGALNFADRLVREIMLPDSEVKYVSASAAIGPLLMDELHKSGGNCFPVVKSANAEKKEIVGTLYLRDVMNHKGSGAVRDEMHKNVEYINEDQTLYEALAAFLKVQVQMLVVLNNFGEAAGLLTLDKVLEQILGEVPQTEFDNYEDPEAVAHMEQRQQLAAEPVVAADEQENDNSHERKAT